MQRTTFDAVLAVCDQLETVASAVRRDTATVLETLDPIEIVTHFDKLRTAMDRIKTAREALQEITDDLSINQIPTIFGNRSLKTMTVEGVGRVTVSYRFSASIIDDPKKGKEPAYEWLRENKAGDLIKPTVNAQSLAAFGKELLEDGSELPAQHFKTGSSPYTSITKK